MLNKLFCFKIKFKNQDTKYYIRW